MAKKSQPADWEAALSGIADGNTVLEYAANRDIFSKQSEGVMTPQKSPPKVVRANGKGKPTLASSKREDSARRLDSIPRRNLARENRSRIRREPHDLLAGRPCGFRVLSPPRQGETRGDIPTRQGSDRHYSGRR